MRQPVATSLDGKAYVFSYTRTDEAVLFFVRPLPYAIAEKMTLELDCASGLKVAANLLDSDEDLEDQATLVVIAAHSLADDAARWLGESLEECAPEITARIADELIAEGMRDGTMTLAADFVADALAARAEEVHHDDNGTDYLGSEAEGDWWVRVHRCKCPRSQPVCGGTWCAPREVCP